MTRIPLTKLVVHLIKGNTVFNAFLRFQKLITYIKSLNISCIHMSNTYTYIILDPINIVWAFATQLGLRKA